MMTTGDVRAGRSRLPAPAWPAGSTGWRACPLSIHQLLFRLGVASVFMQGRA